jgi:hypothetical protein
VKKNSRKLQKGRASPYHPSLQRSNYAVKRAVIRALNHPKQRHLGDRALGRLLGLDHRTIGRWRKRLEGGDLPQKILTKKQFLSACARVTMILPDEMWRELTPTETESVYAAYKALYRVANGGKTLPKRILKPTPESNQ